MESESLSGGEQKIQEYINRIKTGEPKESIMQGLSPAFIQGIEVGLGESETTLEKGHEENEDTMNSVDSVDQEIVDQKRAEREEDDIHKIAELRQKLGISNEQDTSVEKDTRSQKIDELNNRIEKYDVSFPNLDTIINNEGGRLEVVINGKTVEFNLFEILIDPPSNDRRYATVGFIEKKNRTEDKGIGVPMYIELGKRLAEKGITLSASGAQHGRGHAIWMNLAQLGFAKRINGSFEFVNNVEESIEREGRLENGTRVMYQGQEYKIVDRVHHVYEHGTEVDLYSLENDNGAIVQEGRVRKYISRGNFDLI
jgi:hypothetical protein